MNSEAASAVRPVARNEPAPEELHFRVIGGRDPGALQRGQRRVDLAETSEQLGPGEEEACVVRVGPQQRLARLQRLTVPAVDPGELELHPQRNGVLGRDLQRPLDVLHRGGVQLLGVKVRVRGFVGPVEELEGVPLGGPYLLVMGVRFERRIQQRQDLVERSVLREQDHRLVMEQRRGARGEGQSRLDGAGRQLHLAQSVEREGRLVEMARGRRGHRLEGFAVGVGERDERLQTLHVPRPVGVRLERLGRPVEAFGLLLRRDRRAHRYFLRHATSHLRDRFPALNRFVAAAVVARAHPPVYRAAPLARRVPFGQLGPRKSIFDPVHGVVVVRGPALELIGLPAFQRLWGIRQTGFAHLVFPGANHTRLEHSLGVYSVAGALADALDMSHEDRNRVAVGGLLHDLGHGPLSHTLEPSMREALGAGHEARSRAWITGTRRSEPEPGAPSADIPDVLERYDLDPREIADLVDPPPAADRRPLLRELLHGPIDADRIDYLQRDAHYTGVAHGAIDAVRLLDTALVRDDRLVFAEKGRSAVEGFLVGRALMYASVYYHKTVRAAEVMAQAAVERLPDYPTSAVPLFDLTDGELLCGMARSGGFAQRIGRMLTERRLYKRAWGLRSVPTDEARRYHRLVLRPTERRAREDEIAAALGGESGSVLFDLSGLDARSDPESDWAEVALLEEDGAISHPFRGPGAFRSLAVRPPTRWSVSVYVRPSMLPDAQRALGSRIDPLG